MVIWEKLNNFGTQSFNIYREGSIAGVFDSIGNVPITANSQFIDMSVNPNQKPYKYCLSGRDSCGNAAIEYNNPGYAGDSASIHQTIHLAVSQGLSGEVNLAWNGYSGFSYATFYIYRGSAPNNLQILDSVSANTFSYSDYNPVNGYNFYKVTVKNPTGCSPDGGVTIYYQARSNNPYANVTGIDEITSNALLSVYPNPFTSSSILQLNTQLKNAEVVIYDMVGKEIMRRKLTGDRMEIEKGSLESGVYFVRVSSEEGQRVEKMVVE